MYIKKQDFEEIKRELIALFRMSKHVGDFYVVQECDYILAILQKVDVENTKSKNALQGAEIRNPYKWRGETSNS